MKKTKQEIFDLIDDGLERYAEGFEKLFFIIMDGLDRFDRFMNSWKFIAVLFAVIMGVGFVKGIIECIKVYLL